MANSSIDAGFVTPNIDNTVYGCCLTLDPCDRIKDSITYPYQDASQTAVFHGIYKKDGLMKTLGLYINMMGVNEVGQQMNMNNGAKVWQYNLPNNAMFNGTGGPKVVEMPMTAGDQRIRTGFTMQIPNEYAKYRFFVTDEVITLTNAGGANAGGYISAVENRIVLPAVLALFGSDDECMGCDPRCCGEGMREWFIFRQDGSGQETVHVSNRPPAGVNDTRQYGRLSDGSVALYIIRAVGVEAQVGSSNILPTDYGNALRMYKGDEIKIGTIIPITECLPCPKAYPAHYQRKEFRNYSQAMVDSIYCYSQERLYRNTYHEEPNALRKEFEREFAAAEERFANSMMYGQKMMFPQSDYVGGVVPGAGAGVPGGKVPFKTDGLVTLWNKYARKLNLTIADGCDNRCLLEQIKYSIELISNSDYSSGNWVFVGDNYLFHMVQQMIVSRVIPNTVSTAKEVLFGGNQSLLLGSGDFNVGNNQPMIPGLPTNLMTYQAIQIGNRAIPFIHDLEMQLREPGVMYLINLDALEFWHPNRELDKSNGFIPSTGKAGTLLPNIIDNMQMTNLNGQFEGLIPNNCGRQIWSYRQLGAWYTPDQYPMTFKIKMRGIKDISGTPTIVPLNQIACGCYNVMPQVYREMLTEYPV